MPGSHSTGWSLLRVLGSLALTATLVFVPVMPADATIQNFTLSNGCKIQAKNGSGFLYTGAWAETVKTHYGTCGEIRAILFWQDGGTQSKSTGWKCRWDWNPDASEFGCMTTGLAQKTGPSYFGSQHWGKTHSNNNNPKAAWIDQ